MPPAVQNCPNFFSEATLNPLLSTVTSVILFSNLAVEYVTGGRFAIGSDNGGNGVTLSFWTLRAVLSTSWLKFLALHFDMFKLQFYVFDF